MVAPKWPGWYRAGRFMDVIGISFLVYTLAIMGFGLYTARFAKKSSQDYFLADRGLGAWVAALSSSASAESGWVTLGLVGTAFKVGLSALWIVPGTVAAFLFNWFVIANRLRRISKQHGQITIPDVLVGTHTGGGAVAIRVFSVVVILSMLAFYVAAQMTAAAKTFHGTFGWHYLVGVGVGAAIVLIYTVVGGFRAVAWTDVVQAIFMIFAMIVLPIIMIFKLGGFGPMMETLRGLEAVPDLKAQGNLTDGVAGKTGMALFGFFALWLCIPLGYPGQPHVLVRFMATKDEKSVRQAGMIATAWVGVLLAGAVFLGLAARAYFQGMGGLEGLTDPEEVLPIAARELLPGLLAGVMVAAVMAAICSTADSQLLVTASAVSHDLYVRMTKKERTEQSKFIVNRVTVLVIGLIAMGIAMTGSRVVFDFVLYAWAGLGSAFGPGLILSLLWRGTTSWGVLAGIIVGFGGTIAWVQFFKEPTGIYEMGPAFLAAFVAVVVVSLITSEK